MLSNTSPNINPLTRRADLTKFIYNTLDELVPENDDGKKEAFVNIGDNSLDVTIPSDGTLADLYGLNAVKVAPMDKPFQLIPKHEYTSLFSDKEQFNRTLLRNALRRIVDEV